MLEDRLALATGVGVFDSTAAEWALRSTASPGLADVGEFQLGAASTTAVVGDWDGDGDDDTGVFNAATATWSLRTGAAAGAFDAGVFQFGQVNSLPVVGDWNGDGADDIGTFEPASRTWTLRYGASAGAANAGTFQFGSANSSPVVGDWDGDGTDGIGVFVPATAQWELRQTATAGVAATTFNFGATGTIPVTGDWNDDGIDGIGIFDASTATWSLRQTATTGTADVGVFVFGEADTQPIVGDFLSPPAAENELLLLTLDPLDIDLLGLKVQSSTITVTVSAETGNGNLLGNLLNSVDSIINVNEINTALNTVLSTTVDLLNSVDLEVAGVPTSTATPTSTTPILQLFVAPLELDLMGVHVTTSPIELLVTANAGSGLVLGNVLTSLSDLFNPPQGSLNLASINNSLVQLLQDLRNDVPGIPPAEAPVPELGDGQFLALTIPALDLDLLGLMLKATPITVNATATEGDGLLLGNLLTSVFNTLDATPEELTELNTNLNNVLAQVFGILNASTLTLPNDAVDNLSSTLRQLTLPDLVTATPGAETKVLDLVVASPNDGPPITVDVLGLNATVGNIDAELSARTGDGLVLGNLLYNVSNLVNPGGVTALIDLLVELGSGSNAVSNLTEVTVGLSPESDSAVEVLTLTVPQLDVDLLGLELQSAAPITVTVSAVEGDGMLLGNVLTAVSSLLNTQTISNALNNVLGTVVGLLNLTDLSVAGVGAGVFSTGTPSTTQILDLYVAPVRLDLLGAVVETSPISLTAYAHAGNGLVLGNVLTSLTNLFNPPLPDPLTLSDLTDDLNQLLADLNAQIPGIAPADTPTVALEDGDILALTVPAIDLDLLGLLLSTTPITVNASATEGDGKLLGNVLAQVLRQLEATPEELSDLNNTINAVLAKVVGVLNAATGLLPDNVTNTLSSAVQMLTLPDLITATPGATTELLNLAVVSADANPPVNVDLLGLTVNTSDINVALAAQTGPANILGNLLYNIANLLNPRGLTNQQSLTADVAADGEFNSYIFETEDLTGHLIGNVTGDGWSASTATDAAGYLAYGPYTTDIDTGKYSATYRLKIDAAVGASTPVAAIDVYDFTTGTILATQVLYGADFASVSVYQDFVLQFDVTSDDAVLEFRAFWLDTVDFVQDRVVISPRQSLVFEAETDLASQAGVVVGDGRLATVSADSTGYLSFGPYTNEVDAGLHSADFRLQIGTPVAADTPVATIDVYDYASGKRLGWQALRGSDFATVGEYQDFTLQFATNDDSQLEFRTYWYDAVDLKLDHVQVTDALPTVFEAEVAFGHQIGTQVVEGWSANTALDAAGYLAFGPYTTAFDTGVYTANFRLQLDSVVNADTQVARIDVYDLESGERLAVRNLVGSDFTTVGVYQDIALPFQTTSDNTNLEFRTYWYDTADLKLDRVCIVESMPLLFDGRFDLGHQIGAAVTDGWSATTTADAAGYLAFGPYLTELDAGLYTATFNLETSTTVLTDLPAVTIDVYDFNSGKRLASRTILGSDFLQADVDQEFNLQFQTTNDDTQLEFRTFWHDTANVTQHFVRVAPTLSVFFEGEIDFAHQIGRAVGLGWGASTSLDTAGYLVFGPYTSEFAAGTYAAGFQLAVAGNATSSSTVAVIDVYDLTAGRELASRSITRGEFDTAGTYQTFALQFEAADNSNLEFRTFFTDVADLNLDGVRILPISPLRFEAETDLGHHIGVASGDGWSAKVASDNAGYLAFGPYTQDLSAGDYTARFRLSADSTPPGNPTVVTLDIFDLTTNTTLATRTLLRSDFASVGIYQDFDVAFHLVNNNAKLEFRTFWHDMVDVTEDRVSITAALDELFAVGDW